MFQSFAPGDWCIVAGLLLIAVGVGLVSLPAGLVALGVELVVTGVAQLRAAALTASRPPTAQEP